MKCVLYSLLLTCMYFSSCINNCDEVEITYPSMEIVVKIDESVSATYCEFEKWKVLDVLGQEVQDITITAGSNGTFIINSASGLAKTPGFVLDYGNFDSNLFDLETSLSGTCQITASIDVLSVNGQKLTGMRGGIVYRFEFRKL